MLSVLRQGGCSAFKLLLSALICSFGTCSEGALPGQKPNIIFILADDLGYGELGCYGQEKIKTPNLDQLAREGMRFIQCYAGTAVCAPSRGSLMTGMHTGHARIRGNEAAPLQPDDLTVAQLLKKAGYKTMGVGKWGMGLAGTTGTPNKKGFDEWFGYLSQTAAHDYYPSNLYRNERIFTLEKNLNGARGQYSSDLFTMVASNVIRVSEFTPFFLYLAYTIPHANNEMKEKGMEVPSLEPYQSEPWPAPEKGKAAMITRMDRDIGELIKQLKKMKMENNTIVFFSSDNGPHEESGVKANFFKASGPLRGIKRDLYEGGIRVPMIVRWPGKIKPGTVSDQAWAFWDFLPTAAEIVGIQPPSGVDGISILPTLLGQKQTNQHAFFYWEFHEKGSKQAVRMGDWKAVKPGVGQPLELYDLATDAGETQNVADQHKDVVARIEDYLKTARTDSPRWPLRTGEEAAAQKFTKEDAN